MQLDPFFGISFIMSLITYGLIARFYLLPKLHSMSLTAALTPLLLLHSSRHIGTIFLREGVVLADMPSSFAVPAAYGDLLAEVLALIAIAALRLNWKVAIPLIWIFNIEGSVDLVYAFIRGLKTNAVDSMGATYVIPTIIVPALFVTHYIIFKLLLRKEKT